MDSFLYQASVKWNLIHKSLIKFETGFATSLFLAKQRLRKLILENQCLHDENIWTEDNFNLNPPKPVYSTSAIHEDPFSDPICVTD